MMVNSDSKVWPLAGFRTAQQVADEKRVPGVFGDHAHRQAMVKVRAAEQVLNEQFLAAIWDWKSSQIAVNCSGVIEAFVSHQTVSSVVSSRTVNLSFADRPVC
jgi:hypothetical protein